MLPYPHELEEKVLDLIYGNEEWKYPEGYTLNEFMNKLGIPLERRNRIEGSMLHLVIRALALKRQRTSDGKGWIYRKEEKWEPNEG